MTYINMDFDGMQEIVSRLISGEKIEVDTDGFENDFETFRSREEKTARIPNEEVRGEFKKILIYCVIEKGK